MFRLVCCCLRAYLPGAGEAFRLATVAIATTVAILAVPSAMIAIIPIVVFIPAVTIMTLIALIVGVSRLFAVFRGDNDDWRGVVSRWASGHHYHGTWAGSLFDYDGSRAGGRASDDHVVRSRKIESDVHV